MLSKVFLSKQLYYYKPCCRKLCARANY